MRRQTDGADDPRREPFEPAAAGPKGATSFRCSLCGCRFVHGGRVCGSCPMATGCELVKCPNCRFQFPRASRVVLLWHRLAARIRRPS